MNCESFSNTYMIVISSLSESFDGDCNLGTGVLDNKII